jgi:hypothetical protein
MMTRRKTKATRAKMVVLMRRTEVNVTKCQLVIDKSAVQPATLRQQPLVVPKMGGKVVATKLPLEVASKLKQSKYFIDDDSEEDESDQSKNGSFDKEDGSK